MESDGFTSWSHAVGDYEFADNLACSKLVAGWHPSIGKAVLENWQMAESITQAVSDQLDHEREIRGDADLTDIFIVRLVLARALKQPAPRVLELSKLARWRRIGMSNEDCALTITHAEYHLAALQDSLGC